MRRFIIALIIIAALGGAAWFGLHENPSRAATGPSWRTVAMDRGAITAAVSATGTINPTATAIVGSQVSGQVLEILADYNSPVKAGDVLARLNMEQPRAKLDAANADLAQSKALNLIQRAQIEKVRADIERLAATRADAIANTQKADALLVDAQRTFGRQTELNSRGIASGVALQQAKTQTQTMTASKDQAMAQVRSVEAQAQALAAELKVAETQLLSSEAQIRQREAVVRQIEVDIRNGDIRSPVDGVVIQRNIELGQTVAASLQAPTLFLVAQDLTKVEIYANVDESDVGRVLPEQEVTFTVNAYPGREFQGSVKTVRLGSQTIQNVVIYTAVIEAANADLALRPGMTATLRIFSERRENVIRVNNAALRWRPPGEAAPAAPAPSAGPQNPFSMAPAGGVGRGQGQGQGGGQLLERFATELKLDEAQKTKLQEIAREARRATPSGSDTREGRRARAQAVGDAIAERLKPILTPEQLATLETMRGRQAGGRGQPARIYVVDAEGKAVAKAIRIGATDGTSTEVIAGGEEGLHAIIGGAAKPKASGGLPRIF
jgi:HlyD family secretion protein